MKTIFRFLAVFVLCHAAYAAYCQQVDGGPLRLFVIPGLGIDLDTTVSLRIRIPFIDGFAMEQKSEHGATGQTANVKPAIAAVSTNAQEETIPEGQATSVSAFDDIPDPLISKYAEMIGEDVHDIDNYPLYKFVDAWYGVRYRYGGEDKKGIDCSALSKKLYSNIYGCELPRTSKQQHRQCEKVKNVRNAEEGDLIFFRMNRVRISHVGVYLANGYFVHASKSQGVMISNLNSKYWHRRYAGCGRVEREDKNLYESTTLQ